MPNRAALTGIFFVLRSGIPWEMLPAGMGCGSGVTCWRRLWPGAGRVHVAPFHGDKPAHENAGALLSYGIKHMERRRVDLVSESWPLAFRLPCWIWLHAMRRGLEPLRINLGPQRRLGSTPAVFGMSDPHSPD